MPCQSLLVELNDDLGTLDVCLLCRDEIGLVGVFPFHQEHQFTCEEGGSVRGIFGNDTSRNLPEVSVAPMILSGTSPRSKPSFRSVFFFADDFASVESLALRFLASLAAADKNANIIVMSMNTGEIFLFTFFLFLVLFKSRNQLWTIQVLLGLPSIVRFSVSLPFQIIFDLQGLSGFRQNGHFGIFDGKSSPCRSWFVSGGLSRRSIPPVGRLSFCSSFIPKLFCD